MILVNYQHCQQNHPCAAVLACPAGAISQESIYTAPRIDDELCTDCGDCTGACRVFKQIADEVWVG